MIEKAKSIKKLGQRNLWVIYGKSGSGKTHLSASFPKPLLYVQIGDDGANTIASVKGIDGIRIKEVSDLKDLLEEVQEDTKYKTVVVDTFSMVTNEWTDEKVVSKKKRMTQQLWGDLKIAQEELIKAAHKAAKNHIIVLTCHESTDSIEGMEDEITPDVRPSVSKGARTYLEGMANYGIHTTKIVKEISTNSGMKESIKYAVDIGANLYYWTKLQISSDIKIPARIVNPSYDKIVAVINPTTKQTEE